jgi:hypothetical protein
MSGITDFHLMRITMRLHTAIPAGALRGLLLLVALVLLHNPGADAQFGSRQLPTLTLTFDAQVIDADVFYIGDAAFNLQNIVTAQRSPVLLSFNVSADQSTYVLFHIEVTAETDLADEEVMIFSGTSRPAALSAHQSRHFTNRDLAIGGALELYEHRSIRITGGSASEQRVIDAIRATSRLPDGIYYFYLTAYVLQETAAQQEPYQPRDEAAQVVRQLRITNPTRVELLYPMDGDRLMTTFPNFQWRSDTRDVILRVFEIRPGMRSTDEAITGIPHLETRVSERNQFFYPQSGAGVRMLEPGHRYVWYLEGVYRTSANAEEGLISDLHEFIIVDPSRDGTSDILWSQLEMLLEEDYEDIIEQLRQGNIELFREFLLNGAPLTLPEFQMLIEALRMKRNNAAIINVTLRQ